MIKELQIQNFKCFQKSPVFEFSKLNLLTGINGRGKSSLLQSIILLSQSSEHLKKIEKLILNGKYIQLGNFDDIKNSETPRGGVISYKITLDSPNLKIELDFEENELDSLTAKTKKIKTEYSAIDDESLKKTIKSVKDFNTSMGFTTSEKEIVEEVPQVIFSEIISYIHYISADRLGPVKYVDKTSLPEFLNVGARGEYTINILANDNLPLVQDHMYLGIDAKSVIQQTEEWLSYVLEGAKIKIEGKEKTSSVLQLLLNNKNNSYSYKPSNVGFGYSYILPLIVSGLIAQPGETLIIENPEAHLHPKAQSKITEFFARVASGGVQVFIESHSEHILNGLRVSALNPDINIKHDELTIQYFNESFEPVKLVMDKKGKIENWPDGFFDQQEIDLANIFKFTR